MIRENDLEPEFLDTVTIKVTCSFDTFVTVNVKKYNDEYEEYEDIEKQLKQMSDFELLEDAENVQIEDFKKC